MMNIQYLNGGLANQVFQYIFYRYGELANPSGNWFLDDSFFYVNDVHNGYELEKVFGLKPRLLSEAFEPDVWEEFISNRQKGISVPQTLKNLGFDIKLISEFDNYRQHNPFDGTVYRVPAHEYIPDLVRTSDEYLYYHGYWLHPGWFRQHRERFLKELRFPPITDDRNRSVADMILHCHSAAVHIRRGDYLSLGWDSPVEHYRSQISRLVEQYPDLFFFVFSDDLPWCKKHAHDLGLSFTDNVIFAEGNTHGNNFRDLQLMSMCQIILSGKSAFSYLATLLNPQLERFISDQKA